MGKLRAFLIHLAGDVDDLVYVPLIGKNRVFTMVLRKGTAMPVGGIDVDPWAP